MQKIKLKAFTLAEMLVVLVVASILISMAFMVLNMVRKQVVSIQKSYAKKQEVQFFEVTLLRDFNSGSAFYDTKKNQLLLKNTKGNIRYTFLKNSIVRENDTFHIEVADKKLFLDGVEVQQNSIDGIEINMSNNFANRQLFIHQTKDAAFYINE